jgi:hypothetical protein
MELAIAAPVLLILMAGVVDLGRGLTERYRLQQAVNRSLEMAQTGNDATYEFLAVEAAEAANVPVSEVIQEQWIECNGTKKAWTDDCSGGEIARWVKLTIKGSFVPMFGTMGYGNIRADGSVLLTAHASLRVR